MSRLACAISLMAVLLFAVAPAGAHPESLSTLRVAIDGRTLNVTLTLPLRDLSRWFPPGRYPHYAEDVSAELQKIGGGLVALEWDGAPLQPGDVRVHAGEAGFLLAELKFPMPAATGSLYVRSTQIGQLPNDHQQLLQVEDVRRGPKDIRVLADQTLTAQQDGVDIDVPAGPTGIVSPTNPEAPAVSAEPRPAPRATSFYLLGIEHILAGYDHLLFLAALLLVCPKFSDAARVVTIFTVAHSITLALAALDLVRVSSLVVEPAIAASIVYVGIENLWFHRHKTWRAKVVFGFGLLHGLGFASVLRDLGLGSSGHGVVVPLLKFNLGVETGQLLVTSILLPLILLLKTRPVVVRRVVPVCSVLIALIGAFWFVERVIAG